MKLKLSDNLSLPLDAVTQKFAFLGRTGSGKTYAATKLAELMLEADAQVIALDPVGVWHGLRLGPEPFAIPVFGGLRGDIPLEPTGGALVADLLCDRRSSAVLDVSQMIDAEQRRFVVGFAVRFFQRMKAAPSAVHVFLEEAQEFVPQDPKGAEHMLNAFHRIVKIGRNFGIGVSLLTQRPQEVNKKALNQTECLLAFQMTGPQEREAIAAWVQTKGADTSIVDQLPRLKVGHAHVWSPQWLDVSKQIAIAAKRTDDISTTPQLGQRTKAKPLFPIDLERLSHAMAGTIERAKAEDPKALRLRIAELEKQLKEQPKAKPTEPIVIRVPIEDEVEKLGRVQTKAAALLEEARAISLIITDAMKHAQAANADELRLRSIAAAPERTRQQTTRPALNYEPKPARRSANGHAADGTKLAGGERKILTALAQYPSGRTKIQVALLTEYAHNGGGFNNYLSSLRGRGLIEGDGEQLRATEDGLGALGEWDPLPSGLDLLRHWLGKLGKAERAALEALAAVHPSALSKEELGVRTGYEPNGGGFNNALSRLRTLELISGRGELRASEDLFS